MKTKAHQIYKLASGKRVPGVTTICSELAKPALIEWANRIGLEGIEVRRYVDDKADIGTLAHDMVVCYLKKEPVNTDDYSKNQIEVAENACLSFFEWLRVRSVELIWAEKAFVSEKYGFGGQVDLLLKINDVLELVDLKTGSGIYPEHHIQVSAYKGMVEENGFYPERVRILNIPRSNNENWGEQVLSARQIELNQRIFLRCLEIYQLKKDLKGEVVYPSKHKEKPNEAST